jgi:hypothetical protein
MDCNMYCKHEHVIFTSPKPTLRGHSFQHSLNWTEFPSHSILTTASCHTLQRGHATTALHHPISGKSTNATFIQLTAQNIRANILPSLSYTKRYNPWNLAFCGENHHLVNGVSCASCWCLDCCNLHKSITSRVYLLHHCHPPVLWWAIALLDQNQLSGGSFASAADC